MLQGCAHNTVLHAGDSEKSELTKQFRENKIIPAPEPSEHMCIPPQQTTCSATGLLQHVRFLQMCPAFHTPFAPHPRNEPDTCICKSLTPKHVQYNNAVNKKWHCHSFLRGERVKSQVTENRARSSMLGPAHVQPHTGTRA